MRVFLSALYSRVEPSLFSLIVDSCLKLQSLNVLYVYITVLDRTIKRSEIWTYIL
jgi:hypothetical protein